MKNWEAFMEGSILGNLLIIPEQGTAVLRLNTE
jgi:hypothetical protein